MAYQGNPMTVDSTTQQKQKNGDYGQQTSDVYDMTTFDAPVTAPRQNALHGWRYSLVACCDHGTLCCESYCCLPCQVSRQYNRLNHGEPEIDWAVCLLLTLIRLECVTAFMQGNVRGRIRRRYGISGSCCEDFCTAYWCCWCAIGQAYLEMKVMNESPGLTCGEEPLDAYPGNAQMQ